MKYLSLVLSLFALVSCSKEQPFSEQIVRGEMSRCPDVAYIDPRTGPRAGKLSWNYTAGLELKAFIDVAERYGKDDIFNYAEGWYDRIVNEDGTIQSYKLDKYNIDHICPARTLFAIYDKTGKEKYRKAIDYVKSQLDTHPRTEDGCLWHKAIYPHQVWLDGVYMAEPFYAEYISRYYPEDKKAEGYADVAGEFVKAAQHTFDPETKFYRHAWDESKSMFWCNPETGQSDHCWGRALGWLMIATVDVLDFLPEDTPGRDEMIANLRHVYEVLPNFADEQTGLMYQVLDEPSREGNYLESTCNCMFAYAMLKGVRKGYLDASLKDRAIEFYNSVVKTFVVKNGEGLWDLTQCCSVGGLGGGQMRRGDFAYYLSEPIINNDPKGIGPLIWASLEMELIKK